MSTKPVEIKPRRKREGGPAKVDNGLRQTKFRVMPALNQKNYFAEYLKKDSQLLVNRDSQMLMGGTRRAAPQAGGPEDAEENEDEDDEDDDEDDDSDDKSRVVVLQLGSRNARIGFASDPAPNVVPLVLARGKREQQRQKNVVPLLEEPDSWYDALAEVKLDFKERMRYYKRRIPGNAEETVRSFNLRQHAIEIAGDDDSDDENNGGKNPGNGTQPVFGEAALKLGEEYDLVWPIQFGMLNESAYTSLEAAMGDIAALLQHLVFDIVKLQRKTIAQNSVVLVVPDLFEKQFVIRLIELLFNDVGFKNVAIIQEAVAACYGAGISSSCIIDIGAQTSTIACVDEGMIIPDSRVSLRFGGDDITVAFTRLMLQVSFPYEELDLSRSYDFKFAEQLKIQCCTANEAQIAVQLNSSYLRIPGRKAVKYDFKIFDEMILPILGLFYPRLFTPTAAKLASKYSLLPRSTNVYDMKPDDPMSGAMLSISLEALAVNGDNYRDVLESAAKNATEAELANNESDDEADNDDESKHATTLNSPSRSTTPSLPDLPASEPDEANSSSVVIEDAAAKASARAEALEKNLNRQLEKAKAINPKDIPEIPLDYAIIESIANAVSAGTGATHQQFYENLTIVGGGAKFTNFSVLLTDRLTMWLQDKAKLVGDITVLPAPREMDPEMVTWKGASVFARLKVAQELWIKDSDWSVLGARVLQYKSLFSS